MLHVEMSTVKMQSEAEFVSWQIYCKLKEYHDTQIEQADGIFFRNVHLNKLMYTSEQTEGVFFRGMLH